MFWFHFLAVLLQLFELSHQNAVDSSENKVSQPIVDLIHEFFVKNEIRFDIIKYGQGSPHINHVIDPVAKKITKNSQAAFELRQITNINEDLSFKIQQSVVVFLKSKEDLSAFSFQARFLGNLFPKPLKFLIYCENENCKDLYLFKSSFLNYHDGCTSQYFYILYHVNDTLDLTTMEWYTKDICGKPQNIVINTIDKNSQKWMKELKIEERFMNFHKCMIVFSDVSDGYDRMEIINSIYHILGQGGNFTPYVQTVETTDDGSPSDKVIAKDGLILNMHAQLYTAEYTEINMNFIHQTTTLNEFSYGFSITPGELYNSYEKMLLPFDEETWWFLIATFSGAFAIIFVVNFFPKGVKKLLYGDGVQIPAFNVVGTFFGIGQMKLPENNFARIILITFIFFCLIIRTAYQGVQFEMMTKEMRKSSPETILDLYERNFTIVALYRADVVVDLENYFYYTKRPKPRMIFVPGHTEFKNLYRSQIDNSSAKLAFYNTIDFFNTFDLMISRKSKLLKEVLLTRQSGFAFARNNFMYPLVENVLQKIISTGIMKFIYDFTFWLNVRRDPVVDDDGPKILTFGDLSFGFVICLVACGISTCAFLLEVISWLTHKKQKQEVKLRKVKFAKVHPIVVKAQKVKFAKVYPIMVENLNFQEVNEKVSVKAQQKGQNSDTLIQVDVKLNQVQSE